MKMIFALTLGTVVLSGCASLPGSNAAVAQLAPTQGNVATGQVSFVQQQGQVVVKAEIDGLSPGLHGFHIHEKGDCSPPDATAAGGHFNPGGKVHGAPGQTVHHAGDLGNLLANASGHASFKLSVPEQEITLAQNASNSIVGRALIVHAAPDDLQGQPAGNSGKRIACGVIRLH